MKNNMNLHLFRHGETNWNLSNKCQGQIMEPPVNLNETGRSQALETAKQLEGKDLDVIFSSDLHRAKETAEIVAKHNNIEIIYDKRLRETNFGDIQGLESHEQVNCDQCFENYNQPFPNGECVNDVKKRAFEVLLEISKDYDYKNVGIASHGGLIGNVRSDILKEPYRPTKNGEVFSIEYDFEKDEFVVIEELYLRIPKLEELAYRQKIISDPKTMEYNSGYDVDYDGYDYKTGCINFDESKWESWYKKRVENKNSFYSYIYKDEIPVGDAYFSDKGDISLIIEDKYRGKGYAKEALKLLVAKAFNEYNLKTLTDTFPEDRIMAVNLFTHLGFSITKRCEGTRFGKPNKCVLVELTKEVLNEQDD